LTCLEGINLLGMTAATLTFGSAVEKEKERIAFFIF
jgi:hypothetical protein